MKICFVTTGDIKENAAAKRALGMANPLSKLGWDVHILLEDAIENRLRVDLECSSTIHIHYFMKTSAIKEFQLKNKIVKIIKPDYLFICAFVFRNVISSCQSSKKLVEHSELQTGIPDNRGIKKMLLFFLEYYSLFYADGLLCASRYLEKIFVKRRKLFLIKLPIFYTPYAFAENIYILKKKHELPSFFQKLLDKQNFVFLGNITRNYGIFTMLDAFRLLTSKKNIRLILLGKGRHYQEALTYVQEHQMEDFVLMPGYVNETDISNYFSVASAFLSPMNNTIQDWARCPSKLYMYLTFKKPIITCKIGEPYEVLKEKGFYYEHGAAEQMASVISGIFENEYNAVDPKLHTWEQRTKEFDNWIKNTF